jgi:NAD+ diphosphatase
MNHIMPRRPNAYTGGTLDRAAHLRGDDAWLRQAWQQAEARVLPVWRAQMPVRTGADGRPEAGLLPADWGAARLDDTLPWAFLGLRDGAPVFALALDDPEPPDAGSFAELRSVAGLLPPEDAALLAYARALMHWRGRHRFCGVCGHECRAEKAGHELVCPHCDARHFPRTDAAVIMLVSQGDRALLGRSARFPKWNMYSTLAGFVEPGESLEEAVAREVLEETGVRVGPPRYHSSQPWPFPANIMLGFHAEALSEDITIDPAELLDAAWFSRTQLRDPESHGFVLPPIESIARCLIEDWLHPTG